MRLDEISGASKKTWDLIHRREDNDWGKRRNLVPGYRIFLNHFFYDIGRKVLDLAAGQGHYTEDLAQKGFKVTAVEITEAGVKTIRERLQKAGLSAEIIQGNFHRLDLKDESFNTIVCVSAFNRNDWNGAKKTIKEVARVLKKGGLFYLEVSAVSGGLPENCEVINEPIDDDLSVQDKGTTYTHTKNFYGENLTEVKHIFTEEELRVLGNYAGLDVVGVPFDLNKDGEKGSWNFVFKKR